MSEFFPECKRLREMIKTAFELEGIRPYNDAEVEESAYIRPHDKASKMHALQLLSDPSLLKCLSLSEVDMLRKTGIPPADLEQRMTKQLAAEAEEQMKPEDTEVAVNRRRVKFFQMFPEIEQQLSLEEIEKFRRTGDLPSKVFDKFGQKIVEHLVNSIPNQ